MYKQFLQVYVYIYIPMTSDIFVVHIVYNLYGFLARLQEHTAPPTSDPALQLDIQPFDAR